MIEKCIPADKPILEDLEKKKERIARILEKHTTSLTYADWILAERLKHQQSTSQEASIPSSPTEAIIKDKELKREPSRHVSTSETSSRLATSPKEEEVWATDCAVCLAEFEQEEEVRELECEHIFHHECIYDWFMKAKSAACPLCRNQLHSGLSVEDVRSRVSVTQPAPIVPDPPPRIEEEGEPVATDVV